MAILSDLSWVISYPVPCGNCGKESLHMVSGLIHLTEVPCPACRGLLDLNTEEWAALRNQLKKLYVGKKAPIAPVKKRA